MVWGRASTTTASSVLSHPPPTPLAVPIESTPPEISVTTVLSFALVVLLISGAYGLSLRLLPSNSTIKTRILFVWHLFSGLTHLVFEGSFLYNCFFVTYTLPQVFKHAEPLRQPHFLTPPDVYFLQKKNVVFGAAYGDGPFSLLWQEYAKADRRWGGADLTVISLEVLTVTVGTALAFWICELLRRGETKGGMKRWFWMTVLATGELYGGWMTFAPEWFSGSPNLNTSNWLYTWVYLFFFNTLWVWFPLWVLWESCSAINAALTKSEVVHLMTFMDKKDE